MTMGDITRETVLRAIEECDDLGVEGFRAKYGFGPARQYVLVHEAEQYDSKAILNVAHLYATGVLGGFSGGKDHAAARLRELGFVVVARGPQPAADLDVLRSMPLLEQIRRMRTHKTGTTPTRHKPLALLWAIGLAPTPDTRLNAWPDFRDGVGPLLRDFGHDHNKSTPENPFWYLASGPFWEVTGITSSDGQVPAAGRLTAVSRDSVAGVSAGFTEEAVKVLADEVRRAEIVAHLLTTYFPERDHARLLAATHVRTEDEGAATDEDEQDEPVTLDVPGSNEEDRAVSKTIRATTRYDRDSGIVRDLKLLYDNTCQICGTTLRGRAGKRGSDGAHFRPLAEGGPDSLTNLLCLCANHHRELDLHGIYVGSDNVVYITDSFEIEGELTFHSEHRINADHARYHRARCHVDTHPDVEPPPEAGSNPASA
ncbi:HNH endonuclease [Embleya sp. NPDC127516]|uniref:HNH endonuclease n=1 Tax=Embleya sp. NPDC127516 TaxID=3363990 RepID=UPI0038070D27